MPHPSCTDPFDFRKCVVYDADAKRLFHRRARRQLLDLAEALSLAPEAYDLRSNRGGIAVSGEVTLHADRLYVQVSQPGRNNFASLDLLHRPAELARLIRRHVTP